ncbi:hypothetical protein AB4089_14255 [Arthrobacter sp. 2MCAF15]|uniref:hypothetical protein n=1 Tax=Arthrobacter sp. 2MCAF15 TaxID=3232984 RepID=UPI003F8E9FDA
MTSALNGAVWTRQWGAPGLPEPLSIVDARPSGCKITGVELGILTTLAAGIGYGIAAMLKELADDPNSGFRFHFEELSDLVVVTFLTFSLVLLVAPPGVLYRFQIHVSGSVNTAVHAFLRMANWLDVSPRPKKAKESPVIAKAAEEIDWKTILCHGDRRLNRALWGSTDRRRRIAVR